MICLAFDIESVCAGPAGGAAALALPNGSAAPLPFDKAPLPSDKALPPRQGPKLSASAQVQMEAALQKDAFLVFRALCKLSVRASETVTGTDMTAIRGKASYSWSGHCCFIQNRGIVGRTCNSLMLPREHIPLSLQ